MVAHLSYGMREKEALETIITALKFEKFGFERKGFFHLFQITRENRISSWLNLPLFVVFHVRANPPIFLEVNQCR